MAGITRDTGYVDLSSTSTGKFIPQIWSGKLVEKFYDATVFGEIASTDYEGEISSMGDKVIIRTTPSLTINDLAEKLSIPSRQLSQVINNKLKQNFYDLINSYRINEAIEMFKDNPFKVEMIEEFEEGEPITAYRQGDFVDLCRGPHIPRTGMIKALKVTKLAGAKGVHRRVDFVDGGDLRRCVRLLNDGNNPIAFSLDATVAERIIHASSGDHGHCIGRKVLLEQRSQGLGA